MYGCSRVGPQRNCVLQHVRCRQVSVPPRKAGQLLWVVPHWVAHALLAVRLVVEPLVAASVPRAQAGRHRGAAERLEQPLRERRVSRATQLRREGRVEGKECEGEGRADRAVVRGLQLRVGHVRLAGQVRLVPPQDAVAVRWSSPLLGRVESVCAAVELVRRREVDRSLGEAFEGVRTLAGGEQLVRLKQRVERSSRKPPPHLAAGLAESSSPAASLRV
mmetsp:Transcript_26341/g.85693  ORF Transcript_26341/g.85693 Transcript_26341/m.85693 type:complete len:219 (+) Transcript_26341:83-739(+)